MANRNADFLSAIDSNAKDDILASIADRYGITLDEAYAEATGEEAEDLLEYLEEPQRSATSVLMQRHQ